MADSAALAQTSDLALRPVLIDGLRSAQRLHVLLGVDVLVGGAPSAAQRALLSRLAERAGTRLTLVSGRDRSTLRRWFLGTGVACYAQHGMWRSDATLTWAPRIQADAVWRDRVGSALEALARAQRRTLFEVREDAFALLCCAFDDGSRARWSEEIRARVEPLVRRGDARVEHLRDAVEIRPRTHTKAVAVFDAVRERLRGEEIVVFGDDLADEDMLLAAEGHGTAIQVGRRPSRVPWRLEDTPTLERLLAALAALAAT